MKTPVDTEALNDYYWTVKRKQASRRHEERMLSLVGGDPSRLTVTLHGDPYDHFYVYVVDSFTLPDYPWIRYDFMLEYHLKEPNLGIYYGCRCVTEWENDHPFAIEVADMHWSEVQEEVKRVLNATFPDKDFSHEFRETDNANDYTYWPFWLSLYPADDIGEVGVRVLQLIRNVYARHLGLLDAIHIASDRLDTVQTVKTRFTHRNYRDLVRRVAGIVQAREDYVSEILGFFINGCEIKNWFHRDPVLEKGYRFRSCMGYTRSSGCALMIEAFMQYLNEKVGKTGKSKLIVPWEAWTAVFLDSEGEPWTAVFLDSEGEPWTPDALKTKNQKRIRRGVDEFDKQIERIKKEIVVLTGDL